jgi:hypothetical protein
MHVGRLRHGELLALGGLVTLAASLFLDWFSRSGGGRWGFSALGRPWEDLVVLFGLGVLVALVLAQRAGLGRPTYGAVVSLILAGTLGAITLLGTLVRTLLATPGDGLDPAIGTWVGLAGILVALVGLWVAMADERRGAPESRFDPPPPRPVPAPRPDPPAEG